MWSKIATLFLFVFIILIILPFILFQFFFQIDRDEEITIRVYNHKKNQIVLMELDEYLRGVIAAEMPALYHLEALKAQAVAARTYTIRQLEEFGGSGSKKFNGADVSTDYNVCQAYISEEEMKDRWGFVSYFYYWAKINRAVEETRGQVLVHNDRLIDALYHANSGGITESAEYVWGNFSPYLRSVESPFDSHGERNFQRSYYFSFNDFQEVFNINSQIGINDIDIINLSQSGRVLEMRVFDKIYTGREIRERLGLASTKFKLNKSTSIIQINTYGYGHGVGMSQDGANGLAHNGFNYKQILHHYYTDVEIISIYD
ncbi:stage II sporulation protein D [Natronospora cellulosivora (SeqCode)]